MDHTKILMAGLFSASVCMANISGIVTNTGNVPVVGAVVKLEQGGQTAITGADGSFTLVTNTAVIHDKFALQLNDLPVRLSGNVLSMTIEHRTEVEVSMFGLSGKTLLVVRKTLESGNHSVVLPYHGTGIYIYQVKYGNRKFLLKGNSDIEFSGISIRSKGTPSRCYAKMAISTAEKSDIISASKDGLLNYRCSIGSLDTSGVMIKMVANAGNVTDIDGNVYQTVRIGNQVWMAENLRVTRYNDGSPIQLVTSDALWTDTIPMCCFLFNTTDSNLIKNYGALYNGYVVNPLNPKKITPTGWHLPSTAEWDTLKNYLIANDYSWDGTTTGNKIAKSLAAKTDWKTNDRAGAVGCNLTLNNETGFSALPSGSRIAVGGFNGGDIVCSWWAVDEIKVNYAYAQNVQNLSCFLDSLYRNVEGFNSGFSIRLLRD